MSNRRARIECARHLGCIEADERRGGTTDARDIDLSELDRMVEDARCQRKHGLSLDEFEARERAKLVAMGQQSPSPMALPQPAAQSDWGLWPLYVLGVLAFFFCLLMLVI